MTIGRTVIVALALVLTALASASVTAAPRDDCAVVKTVPVPPGGQDVVVPVIVRFMKNTDPSHARDPEERLSTDEIESFFGPRRTINTIWRRAGIVFALHRIERCPYAAGALGFDQGFKIPAPTTSQWEAFWRVNDLYNFGEFGLDVYVWWGIKYGLAFAAPHGGHGTGNKGAIWLGSDCLMGQTRSQCETLIAHETGHFLGLCHVCMFSDDPPPSQGPSALCHTCWRTAPECYAPRAPRNRLMRADASGTTLSQAEATCAVGKARERIQP